MPRIGRPPRPEPTIQWCFRLPASLASRLDLLLRDPVTGAINPNVKQDILVPILGRLWQATLSNQTTIDVTDVVAGLRQRLTPID